MKKPKSQKETGIDQAVDVNTRDRFDLEQEILQCWNIVDDITQYVESGASAAEFKILSQYYERKFDRLWDTFGSMVENRKM